MEDRATGTIGFVDDIGRWRRAVRTRAPSYHRILQELVTLLEDGSMEGADVERRLREAWAARTFRVFYDRPLLFLASLRVRALVEGTRHPLWSALAAPEPDPESVTRRGLLATLADDVVWLSLRTRFVQTNETSRAIAWLWPAHVLGCSEGQRPLALVEVGTAAGLDLVADRLPSPWVTPSGAPVPTVRSPRTLARIGIDSHPLDARGEAEANWLRACVWAGEQERLGRLEAAISAFRDAPADLERGDVTEAPEKLRALSARLPEGTLVLAFQTIVRDYLDEQTRATYERGMKEWIANAPAGTAAWVELEIDHTDPSRVPIVVHAREAEIVLGVTGYHPETVAIDDEAVERLRKAFV